MKYKIDHPKAKAILEKYLNVLVPRIAGHPALFSYCLFNEPSYADTSEYSHKKFQAWLEAKHGSIQTLSRRHGFDYGSFDTIPLPAGVLETATRGEQPALASEAAAASQAPLLYDWYRFNQERFSQAHQWVVDTVHALDPDTPVHSKVQATLFDTYLGFASGVDHEQWTSATDISGNDNWSYYRSWTDHDKSITGKYASNWWRQAMYYDYQRSVAPGRPVFNSENHPIEDDTPIWVAERHIRTLYWQGAIHGQGATTTWVWERGDGPSIGDCMITRSNCAHALGTVGLDLLRLSKEIVALQKISPEIALLVVPSSVPFAEDYLNAMKEAYEGLHFLGAPVGFVTDRQAKRGEWANYKAVIVPEAERISDDLIAQLDAYVADGGTMLVVGNSFASDEYGHARALPAFLTKTAGEGVAGITSHGRGKIIYRPTGMGLDAYQQLGEALMVDLGVHRPIRVTDENGRVVTGVEYRSTRYREGYLLNVVNYGRREFPVRLVAPKRIGRVTNLFDGAPARDFLELAPLEPLLLSVETAP